MKAKYTTLYDRQGSKRGTICILKPDWTPKYKVYVGISFRSDDDIWEEKIGRRIAYARAIRALKNRPPCYAKTRKVYRNILNLNIKSLKTLMRYTVYQTRYFPKGFKYLT